jgi:hypothetical protein
MTQGLCQAHLANSTSPCHLVATTCTTLVCWICQEGRGRDFAAAKLDLGQNFCLQICDIKNLANFSNSFAKLVEFILERKSQFSQIFQFFG